MGLNEIDFLFSFHYAVAPCCQEVLLFLVVPFYVTARIKNSKSIWNKGKIKIFKKIIHVIKLLINHWNCFYPLKNNINCSEKKFCQTAEVHFSNIGTLYFIFPTFRIQSLSVWPCLPMVSVHVLVFVSVKFCPFLNIGEKLKLKQC